VTQKEKDRLLSMFSPPEKWCKGMEACDSSGESVHYNDPAAAAWDLSGCVCLLFGWDRAAQLFPQIERHLLNGKQVAQIPNVAIAAMVALQEFNDRPEMTHQELLERMQTMPVWSRGPLKGLSVPEVSQLSKEMSNVQGN
jgi:hypothetical protein